jgi:hypothetical protein
VKNPISKKRDQRRIQHMSKLTKSMFALIGLLVFTAMPAFSQSGCKNGKFPGSYVTSVSFPDIWGDGSNVNHTFVLQLNLHGDGTAYENYTGLPDLMLSSGTGTPSVGSWQCRQDGKLIVTLIDTAYLPTNDAALHGILNVPVDLFLRFHSRTTYLFSVNDENTLTRIQARSRRYAPAEDPTDPNGGTLRPLNTSTVDYKRLVASEADLLAP